MKKYLLCLGIILLCFLFSGCGENANRTEDGRMILTYGYIDAYSFKDLSQQIKEKIVEFNRSQDEYYIEIKKYGEDSYEDGLSVLNAEIAAGKGPDIIQIDNEEQLGEYGRKSRIVDLYSFMGEDSELKKEDFLDNILQQFEIDGKLYGLYSHFAIHSTVGNPNLLDSENITFSQLCDLLEENKANEEIVVYQNISKENVLSYCVFPELELFVDWENKTCDFRKEEFKTLIEFSDGFPYMEYARAQGNEPYIKMQNNELYMIYENPIVSFNSYLLYKSFFGEDALLLGWPTMNGSGPQISTNVSPHWAINSNSKNQEGAWQFITSFFESDYMLENDNIINGFPVTKTAFEMCAMKAMGCDTEGGEVVGDNRILTEISSTDAAGITICYPVYAATEAEVEYIKNIIASITPTIDYGEIELIIYEEVTEYWNGTKVVDDVIDVIQNRVQLYLNEIK